MIYGHGDDTFSYPEIQVNFSSNCCCNVNNEYLIRHLQQRLAPLISAYPHPSGLNLRKKIADCEQIPETRVAVFNGATEAIYTIARFIESNKVYIAGPTFSEYEAASTATGKSIEKIYLQDLITGKVSQFEKRSMVWLCNPNNPDGVHFPKNRLQELINSNPDTWFVIDQSYADFIDFPVIYPADAKNNVILVYSLTKQYTIPGLRLGYVIASEEVITALEGGRMPWSVNALALEAGCFLLSQPVDFKKIRARLHPEVKRIQQAFESTGQIETYPSDTHYFLSRLRTGNASSLKEFLARKHGLLIRNAENFAPHYKGYFRIAVQTPKENDLLIEAIKQYDFSL